MALTNSEKIAAVHSTARAVGGDVRADYSGRGMYGETCYAIDCDDRITCIERGARRGLRGAKYDQMGKGWVVYWPGVHDAPEGYGNLTVLKRVGRFFVVKLDTPGLAWIDTHVPAPGGISSGRFYHAMGGQYPPTALAAAVWSAEQQLAADVVPIHADGRGFTYKGHAVRLAKPSGGKAGKGNNRTTTLQVYGPAGGCILAAFRFILANPETHKAAARKARDFIDRQRAKAAVEPSPELMRAFDVLLPKAK